MRFNKKKLKLNFGRPDYEPLTGLVRTIMIDLYSKLMVQAVSVPVVYLTVMFFSGMLTCGKDEAQHRCDAVPADSLLSLIARLSAVAPS